MVKETSAVLGGDIFGCIVIPGHACSCDAILAMVKMFEIIAKNGPLGDQISRYPDYYITRDSISVPEALIPSVLEAYKSAHDGKEMELQDGVKVYSPEGWILVRKSNVRDLIKIYTQSGSRDKSASWLSDTLKELKSILSSLDSSPEPQ
jgi:phosphomannomutase